MINRRLAYLGLVGGFIWLVLFLFPPDFGYPGSLAYLYYQWYNRLWSPALLLMTCGFLAFYRTCRQQETAVTRWAFTAVFLGFGLMIAGNTAEFWFFTTQPYGELNARSFAWMTVLLGALFLLVAAFILGVAWLRSRQLPVWVSGLFIVALPLTIAGLFWDFLFLPIAPLVWVMSGLTLRPLGISSPVVNQPFD
ncbi:MAG: hypothetical protein R6X34_20200 [Chloroflexota bacterium]